MIDISSLPEHELTGLEGFEAKELYEEVEVISRLHINQMSDGSYEVYTDADPDGTVTKFMDSDDAECSWSEPEKLLTALKDYLCHSYGHWEANL